MCKAASSAGFGASCWFGLAAGHREKLLFHNTDRQAGLFLCLTNRWTDKEDHNGQDLRTLIVKVLQFTEMMLFSTCV